MKVYLRHPGRSRWCGCAAWLAIFALLADMLLPAGVMVAMPPVSPAAIGYCGSAPPPDHPPAVPAAPHCIYCLLAPIGPAPASPPRPAAPRFVGIAAVPSPGRIVPVRHYPFAAAQPRGPPGSANHV